MALNAFHKEIFKLHFLLNQGKSIFLKETRLQGKMRLCFVIYAPINVKPVGGGGGA